MVSNITARVKEIEAQLKTLNELLQTHEIVLSPEEAASIDNCKATIAAIRQADIRKCVLQKNSVADLHRKWKQQ